MTPKEAAAELDGDDYANEGSLGLFAAMEAAGLVAVFTSSDDLMEFVGAIEDEAGSEALLDGARIYSPRCRDERCPHEAAIRKRLPVVRADFGASPFTVTADWPHETFTIVEDGEPYCRGIVFALADVPSPTSA